MLETMYWPDEIRAADFGGVDVDVKVRDQELEMAKPADREPHGRVGPRGVHRRVPRGAAADRRGEDLRRGDRGRRGRAHREGGRPDGGPEGERRRGEEAARGRRRALRSRGAEARREEARGEDDRQEDGGKKTPARKKAVGGVNLPPGFTSRPATLEDLEDVAALVRAWDLKYVGESEACAGHAPVRMGSGVVRHRARHARDPCRRRGARRVRANTTPDRTHRYEAFGPVHPDRSRGEASARRSSTGRRRRRVSDREGSTRLCGTGPVEQHGRDQAARGERLRSDPIVLADDHRLWTTRSTPARRPRA